MEKIDKLDRQILNIISKNARIPFKDVAEECGVSRAAIHQRVLYGFGCELPFARYRTFTDILGGGSSPG